MPSSPLAWSGCPTTSAPCSHARQSRARLPHVRFADWLEQTAGSRLREFEEILGYHLERAHQLWADLGLGGAEEPAVAARAAEHWSRPAGGPWRAATGRERSTCWNAPPACIAIGHSLSCIHVLLLQHVGERVATATGVSGRLTRKDKPKREGRWMVNTQLAKGSKQFVTGKPALAMAMAIAKDEDGGAEIERWSQAVTIVSSG
jgi:hypothetical protein